MLTDEQVKKEKLERERQEAIDHYMEQFKDSYDIEIEENNMDNKLDFDEVCDLASKLYWKVVNKFDAENKCVMSDPDNKGGTRNTKFGQELYYLIEDTIKESIDYKEEEDDDNDD